MVLLEGLEKDLYPGEMHPVTTVTLLTLITMQHRPFGLGEGLGKSPIYPWKMHVRVFKVTNTYQVVFLKGLEKYLCPRENAA